MTQGSEKFKIVRDRLCYLFAMALAALGAWSGAVGGAIVQVVADRDNTLFEDPLGRSQTAPASISSRA